MHSAKSTIIITILAVLIVTGTGLGIGFGVNANKPENDIEIILGEHSANQDIDFNLTGIYPGKSDEYDIKFKGDERVEYALNLTFVSNDDSVLSKFIVVDIIVNDELIANERLNKLLDGKSIVVDAINTKSKVTIRYTMPEDTGNEATKTTADFALKVMVSR